MLRRKKKGIIPKIKKEMKGRKLLVLDLDETLIHSTFGNTYVVPEFDIEVETHDGSVSLAVQKRPYLDYFLKTCGELFEICIFTAGTKEYADPMIDYIDRHGVISHRLYRRHCTSVDGVHVKDLSKLGRDLTKLVMIDNSPKCFSLQKKNGMEIRSWYFDQNDRELLNIVPTLKKLARERTVYKEIKNWRKKIEIKKSLVSNLTLVQRERRRILTGYIGGYNQRHQKRIIVVPNGVRGRNRKLVPITQLNMDMTLRKYRKEIYDHTNRRRLKDDKQPG